MNFISEDAKLAVKRGIYWLDENYPGWAQQINLEMLDMSECTDCVIGQAIGSYSHTINLAAVGNGDYNHSAATQWSVEHGFETPNTLVYSNPEYAVAQGYSYRELDTLWSEEVQKRLG